MKGLNQICSLTARHAVSAPPKRKLTLRGAIFGVVLLVTGFSGYNLSAQTLNVKTNVLYDATASINLGAEVALAPKWTLDVSGNYNPFTFSDNKKWKHWLVQPEARYWFCERFNGSFLGIHLHGGEFNCANCGTIRGINSRLFADCRDSRNEGWYYGAGVAYGYQWLLGKTKRWSFELELGVGYVGSDYDVYEAVECGACLGKKHNDYFGLTKASASIIFFIF